MSVRSNKIRPFTVHVEQSILDDMKARISNTRWTDEIIGSGWSNGTNLGYLKELAAYWVHEFDWRKLEAEINFYPNFLAEINGHTIHFMHIRGKGKISVPLVITHGWPGSFLEMMKLVPLLTSDENFSFDLVIPSIMGFGFSEKITEPGCNSIFVADLWLQLMKELGYKKFGAQGGDIGAGISAWLALRYPENILGLHLNFIPGSYNPYVMEGEPLVPGMEEYLKKRNQWIMEEGAYSQLHRTKPISLAHGLNDSPIGLCSWIIEKFHTWSDNKGHIENSFTKDELLGNITLYWVTQTIHSSIRIYKENANAPMKFGKDDFVRVPVAFANFIKEISAPPRPWIEKGFNIRHWTDMPEGGHFAALEQPRLLADDIIDFFKSIT